jgi:hypothetical protein
MHNTIEKREPKANYLALYGNKLLSLVKKKREVFFVLLLFTQHRVCGGMALSLESRRWTLNTP